MKHTLTRQVICDGREYGAGTDLADIPKRYRESIVDSGWSECSDPNAAVDDAGESVMPDEIPVAPVEAAAEDSAADDAANEQVEQDQADRPDLDRPINELGLSDDITSLLSGAGITNIGEALAHKQTHQSFRTIKGIGKVSNEQIVAAIG